MSKTFLGVNGRWSSVHGSRRGRVPMCVKSCNHVMQCNICIHVCMGISNQNKHKMLTSSTIIEENTTSRKELDLKHHVYLKMHASEPPHLLPPFGCSQDGFIVLFINFYLLQHRMDSKLFCGCFLCLGKGIQLHQNRKEEGTKRCNVLYAKKAYRMKRMEHVYIV